jgi:Asp-tRNA(Asn)/Glu-tRNA(Gln) amidotransferase B subunit
MGAVMKEARGKTDPALVGKILREKIGKTTKES